MPASKHVTYQGGERDGMDSELQALASEKDGAALLSRVTEDGDMRDRILGSLAPSQSDPRSKSLAIMVLSRAISIASEGSGMPALTSALGTSLTDALSSPDVDAFMAGSEALTVLCALAPEVACTLLADPPEIGLSEKEQESTSQPGGEGLLELLFDGIKKQTPSDERSRALANLSSAAGSVAPTRKILCGQSSAARSARAWLDTQARHTAQPTDSPSASYVTLVSALARLKLQKQSSGSQDSPRNAKADTVTISRGKMQQQQSELLDLASAAVLRFSAASKAARSDAEALRPALEALSLLSLISREHRSSLVARVPLLKALCALVRARTRSVFPARGSGTSSTSTYDLDEQLSRLGLQDTPTAPDTALHLALASLFASLVTYPHARPGAAMSKEDKQMEKLRRVASGMKGSDGEGGDEGDEVDPPRMVDARAKALQDAGAVSALVAIIFGGSASSVQKEGSGTLHHSSAVRRASSLALYGFCVRQDRTFRGQIVQQKGARALLALGTAAAEDATGSAARHAQIGSTTKVPQPLDLTPSHALSLLLIALPPSLVLGDSGRPAAAPLLAALLLSPQATALQRFEALLALTNMASEGGGAQIVANARAPEEAMKSGSGLFESSAGSSSKGQKTQTVRNALEDTILFEPEQRIQRAAVELLCNLAATDEPTLALWSGQAEAEAALKSESGIATNELDPSADKNHSRARSRLHALVAFCAPSGASALEDDEDSSPRQREPGMPLRLAASGALAMLVSNTLTAPAHLLALQPRTLRHLARLIHPDLASTTGGAPVDLGPRIRELVDGDVEGDAELAKERSEDDDAEEREAHETDLRAYPEGPTAARLALAHRGAAVAVGMVNYLQWRDGGGKTVPGFQGGSAEEERSVFVQSGILAMLQAACSMYVREMRQGVAEGGAGRDGLLQHRREVVETALQAIKVADEIGLEGSMAGGRARLKSG